MSRLPDWEARLAAYLADVADRPHASGTHDCALHGANAAAAITGEDKAGDFRGRYSTELGAARALRSIGVGSLEATYDDRYPVIAPALAGRGDLVLAGGSIGVCVGGFALFVGEEGARAGLVRVERAGWTRAWRV